MTRQKEPEPRAVPVDVPKQESSSSFYIISIVLVAGLIVGIFLYRSFSHGGRPGQSTDQAKQTEPDKSKAAAAVTPVALPRPPFDYFLGGQRAEDSKVRLVEQSEKPNQVIDQEQWFGNNDLSLAEFTVPNAFKQEAGNLPPQIPPRQGDDLIIKAIKQDNNVLCVYGRNYGSGRYLTSISLDTGKVNFALDFHEYMHPPKYLDADREFVDETVHWAQVKENVLYVSTGHNTYARSSYGLNAYLNAIDVNTGRLLWRSAPLVSNSANFLLYQDAILTGYGFTDESHYLYVLNQKDGRIVQKITTKKMVEYILNKADDIYVRTYNLDYIFKASAQ